MQLKILRKHEQITTRWTGGTTTQLAVFPETATYNLRNFIFRISTAKVEAETSDFTHLPGITRSIMVLDGTLQLTHQGHHTKTLHKFDTDIFDGGWKTSSKGQVTDFNLMTTPPASGILRGFAMQQNETLTDPSFKDCDFIGFYSVCGKFEVAFVSQKMDVDQGDFLLIKNGNKFIQISVKACEYCEFVVVEIHLT